MLGFNKVIRTLIISDFLLQSGWGFIGPIFAIFITNQIQGGSLEMVGFVAATYWLSKALAQPFIARFLDIKKGERDDLKVLIYGMIVANLVPIGYAFSDHIIHIFILEFIRGLAMACVIPTWSGFFTRHIDKGWENFSWSIESTSISMAYGFAAAFGGIMAIIFGFKVVFVLVSILGLISSVILLSIKDKIYTNGYSSAQVLPREKIF